jgi:hypothetical protein
MRRQNDGPHYDLAQEAARVICEEQVTDFRVAKQKAAQRLGLGPRAALPDNAAVQQAVLEYQRLFGGHEYLEHLNRLRRAAVQTMKLLAAFQPRLVGAAVSGAINASHRVQLHAFLEKPEILDIFLQDRGLRYEAGDRRYRYSNGQEREMSLVCFDADGIGVDVAVFPIDESRHAPLNPADGLAYKRLDLVAVEALLNDRSE